MIHIACIQLFVIHDEDLETLVHKHCHLSVEALNQIMKYSVVDWFLFRAMVRMRQVPAPIIYHYLEIFQSEEV